MSDNPYMRKKQPEQVRRALLDAATQILVNRGAAALTIQAVAEEAGVTKGGLFHHFASKQALIAGLHEDLFETLEVQIDAAMAEDTEQQGRFTRAYIRVFLSGEDFRQNSPWIALSGALMPEQIGELTWANWLDQRLTRHRETDDTPALEVVRYAVDGAWFAYISRPPSADRLAALRERLIDMTYGAGKEPGRG